MKTLTRVLCVVLAALLMAAPLAGLAAVKDRGYYYVKTEDGNGLNLRTEPRKADNNFLVKLPYRASVLIYEFNSNKTWAFVEAQNPEGSGTVKGWVMTSYLVSTDPGPYKGKTEPTGEQVFNDINNAAKALKVLEVPYYTVIKTKVATNFVHLRWFPSTSACYSGAYLAGTEIRVLAESKTWAQVEIVETGLVGFILKSCVETPMF